MRSKVTALMITGATTVILMVLGACGGSSSRVPVPNPTDVELIVDLQDYVDSALPYVPSYSEDYAIPSAADLDRFDTLAAALIDGRLDTVRNVAAAINFELVRVVDTGAANNEYYCLRERVLRGQGLYCIDYDAPTAHFVSVPHPLYDSNTNVESIAVLGNDISVRPGRALQGFRSGAQRRCLLPPIWYRRPRRHPRYHFYSAARLRICCLSGRWRCRGHRGTAQRRHPR